LNLAVTGVGRDATLLLEGIERGANAEEFIARLAGKAPGYRAGGDGGADPGKGVVGRIALVAFGEVENMEPLEGTLLSAWRKIMRYWLSIEWHQQPLRCS